MTRLLLVLVLLLATGVAHADHRLTYHWTQRGDGPVNVALVNQAPARFPVAAAARAWNAAAGVTLTPATRCPANRGCVVVRAVRSRTLGRTLLYPDRTGHIARAVVEISSTRTMSAAKRRSVVCHELGHAVGLDHRASSASCMVNGRTFPTHPDRHDLAELRDLYRHRH